MDLLSTVWDWLTRLDHYLPLWAAEMGQGFYALMFAIVFAETGLVIFPFLPGDALIFALGILCAQQGSGLDPWTMSIVLVTAALCGDNVNYWIGRRIGPAIFRSESSRFLNKKHLIRAQEFYEKHGAKTIVLARYIAIVRTFAPFVAGIGRMDYRRFLAYSVGGAIAWVASFITLGYMLGNNAWVKANFSAIVWGIMGVTVLLGIVEAIKAKCAKKSDA